MKHDEYLSTIDTLHDSGIPMSYDIWHSDNGGMPYRETRTSTASDTTSMELSAPGLIKSIEVLSNNVQYLTITVGIEGIILNAIVMSVLWFNSVTFRRRREMWRIKFPGRPRLLNRVKD